MRKKLARFSDNAVAPNVIEPGKTAYETVKAGWHHHFGKPLDIGLELGCGRGTYTVALAERYPQRAFVGVDIKGARLWAGSQEALSKQLSNVAFLRTDITSLHLFFSPGEVTEIYLPFPDPRPRDSDARKRLTSPRFLELYARLLRKGGKLYFKTDSAPLFAYTRDVLDRSPFVIKAMTEDVHATLPENDIHRQVQTPYEKRFLAEGKKIHYIACVLG